MEQVPGRVPLPPLDLVPREARVAIGEGGKDEEGDEEREEEERDQDVVEEGRWAGKPAGMHSQWITHLEKEHGTTSIGIRYIWQQVLRYQPMWIRLGKVDGLCMCEES